MRDWQGLFALGRRQHGALALSDGERFGWSRNALLLHARRQGWERPQPGVVLLPGTQRTFETRVATALLQVGGRVLAGRRTAAYVLGMVDRPPATVEMVLPADRRLPRLEGVEAWRSRTLHRADAINRNGLRLTAPGRTVVDLAAVMGVDRLRSLMIDARQRRVVRLEEIAAIHERIGRTPGGPRLTQVLAELDEECCDSMLEWYWRRALRAHDLHPHPRPFPFRCADGITIEIDVAFPDQWVACECDGL
ncbi:MAG: hypothetical protein GEU81_14330, partial [Nitriliruptorales bacterium]|nr:hypothetical protein [Nitriliruptorales bacterium]